MLSAQKQEMPNDTAPESSRPATASGFGKVLTSIQGLQQRLDDFSVEEVSLAHAKAQNLICHLGELQARLGALAKLKNAIAAANVDIGAIPQDDFELVGPDSLEKHPQLRAIVQAGKLIRMHRLLRAARASAESVSFDFPTRSPRSGTPSSVSPLPQISPRSKEPDIAPVGSDLGANGSAAYTGETTTSEEQSSPLAGSPATQDSQAGPIYEFTGLKLEEPQTTASPHKGDAPPPEKSVRKRAAPTQTERPLSKAHFDQRLLNDLIETYGEFTFSTGPAAVAKTTEANRPTPESDSQATAPIEPSPTKLKTIQSASTELALLEPASVEMVRAEPAFVEPVAGGLRALPAPEKKLTEPAFADALPNAKSRGEIDRQLKNIIKDYGEYDLYSHQKSTSIKTAAIAAAAVLGLVLGGLYFFKTPSSSAPAAVEIMMPSGQTAVEAEQPANVKQILKQKN